MSEIKVELSHEMVQKKQRLADELSCSPELAALLGIEDLLLKMWGKMDNLYPKDFFDSITSIGTENE